MKKIQEDILKEARGLFNESGVANVSIREIARVLGISHSNLIYHFENKNALIEGIHDQLLKSAVDINQRIKEESPLRGLFISTVEGFKVLYEYRFFMLDMVWILRENKSLHAQILDVEQLRFKMYEEKIKQMIDDNIMNDIVAKDDCKILITQVRIISDAWLTSAHVYSSKPEGEIEKYAMTLLFLFYPYLTDKGKDEFQNYSEEFGLTI